MNNEFINKLLAAGFDVQTQNQGTVVTVSYTQAGSSFDSNLKEIEKAFKQVMATDQNSTPVNTGVTSNIYEWICSIVRNPHDGLHQPIIIDGWDWVLAGKDGGYRMAINPDSNMSYDAMKQVCNRIKTMLGCGWRVILDNRIDGINITKKGDSNEIN